MDEESKEWLAAPELEFETDVKPHLQNVNAVITRHLMNKAVETGAWPRDEHGMPKWFPDDGKLIIDKHAKGQKDLKKNFGKDAVRKHYPSPWSGKKAWTLDDFLRRQEQEKMAKGKNSGIASVPEKIAVPKIKAKAGVFELLSNPPSAHAPTLDEYEKRLNPELLKSLKSK